MIPWPTEAEWYAMKLASKKAAAQRTPQERALFQKYEAWRNANPGWQNWDAPQFRQAKKAAAQQAAPAAPGAYAQYPTPATQPPPPPATTPPPPPPPPSGGGTTAPPPSGGGAAPGPGTTQDPIAAGGVWWGGKFYKTPHELRVALGLQNYPQKWQEFLGKNPVIANWVNWYNSGQPTPPGGGEPAPGPNGEDDWIDTDGDGIGDVPGPPGGGGQEPPETGGGTTNPGVSGPTDWSSVLGIAGLPADLVSQINAIFSKTTDTNAAIAMALGVVRGSAWYAQTFPGITQGIQKGLFSNEQGYRDYRNALDQVYRQWTGSAADAGALQAALAEGVSPDLVDRRFQSQGILGAYRPDLAYYSGAGGTHTDLGRAPGAGTAFTEAELKAFADQQAGLGTVGGLGIKVERAFELARRRVEAMFQGQEASPQLALTGQGRLFSPTLSPGRSASSRPDIPS